jgi:bis(5'-nucleosyl)-tetraphosphatase (symmetrical)
VLGNHDLHRLARAAGAPARRGDTLDGILAAPDVDALIDWMRHQPLAHVEAGWLMIHAGLDPFWSLADVRAAAAGIEARLRGPAWRAAIRDLNDHETAMLTRARLLYADGIPAWGFKGPPEAAPSDEVPWFAQSRLIAERQAKVIFGHWAALDFRRGAGWVSLDSGCIWGRRLTAMRLEDGRAFHVPADPADLP